MEGSGESNNNSKVFRRGLDDEDSSFSTFRSSLRARRDRLARRESLLQPQESDEVKSPSTVTAVATPDSAAVQPYTPFTRQSATRRSRLANEYSQPKVDTIDDETALSLLTSSKILSMDDSVLRPGRGLSAGNPSVDSNRVSQGSVTPTDSVDTVVPFPAGQGESGSMHGMRKSLPTNMRSRRNRRDRVADDIHSRTPSREIVHTDINGLNIQDALNAVNTESPLVNGTDGHRAELRNSTANGQESGSYNSNRRRSLLDEPDSMSTAVTSQGLTAPVGDSRARSNSDRNGSGTDTEKPAVERTTSGSTTMSAGAVPGETREERIARYKEMRKAVLAARTTQHLDSGAEDNATPVSGYVPRYLKNRDGSGASCDRNKDDDTGSGYVSRWSRRYNNDDNDMASSSNASSMTDLHVVRKDSSASSDNSSDNGPCKLTYENLKLHDKLSSTAPPYSSLSRLEESPTIAPIAVEEISRTQDSNEYHKHTHRKDSTNDVTPTNSPALATRASSRLKNKGSAGDTFTYENTTEPFSERVAKRQAAAGKSTEIEFGRDRRRSSTEAEADSKKQLEEVKPVVAKQRMDQDTTRVEDTSKTSNSASETSDTAQQKFRNSMTQKMATPVLWRGSGNLSDRLKKFEPSAENTSSLSKFTEKTGKDEQTGKVNNCEDVGQVERRPNRLSSRKEPRPVSVATDEPLLDPQLAAMLEARKIKAGESTVSDVANILKSRMRKREELDGKKSTISVAARASFFKEEQNRVAEPVVIHKPPLDRHPSAKIPQVDKKDTEARRAIGVKRAMLSKKRQRSATQPITRHEVVAAKGTGDAHLNKSHDDLELLTTHPFRGRLLSVPTTYIEIREVKRGAPPQKYVRPRERKPAEENRAAKKSVSGRPTSLRNVTAKVDSGRSVLGSRGSNSRSSMRASRDPKTDPTKLGSAKASVDSPTDNKASPSHPNKFMRRSASVRATSSSTNSVKAAADRANALVEARKAASQSKKSAGKVGDAIRSRASAKVDSRRISTQLNGSAKRLNVKISDTQASSTTTESCPLSPASTASTVDRHAADSHSKPRKLSVSTVNSEDVPGYMRVTAASQHKDRMHTPGSSILGSSEELSNHQPKRRSASLRDLESGAQPSYMKPTNSFAHRLEAKLDDLTPSTERDPFEVRPKSKPVSLIEQEMGQPPSFMKPTASSTKRLEKGAELEEEKSVRVRRAASPTLPDGDLPSYMKATESYFKKVEHLFEEDLEEASKPAKKISVSKPLNDDELPSFMKPTKAFEALISVPVEEPAPERVKKKSVITEPCNGEMPSYMKSTASFNKHVGDDLADPLIAADKKHKGNSAVRISTKSSSHTSAPQSENGDIPSHTKSEDQHKESEVSERRKSQSLLSNGDVPSFMKPTKSFEIRDRHNEEAMLQQDQQPAPERKTSCTKKPRVSLVEGELPSYMKNTRSREQREQAISSGALEPSAFEIALQGPMIDAAVEPLPAPTKSRKTSVGGFLKKKFGIGKGTSVDSASSSSTAASKSGRKNSSSKAPGTKASGSSKAATPTASSGDVPSYMKPTSNSSQRKVSESLPEEGDEAGMSATTMTATDSSSPLINITQVSIDNEEHEVAMRPKRSAGKLKVKEDINSNNTSRPSISNRSASVRVRGTKAQTLLASLQVNGEEGWKRRVGEKDHGSFRSGTIHDRLSKMEDRSKNWQKNKGLENDSKQFTVEGKMAIKTEVKVAASPLMPRKEKTMGAAKRANSLRLKREDDKTAPKITRPLSMQTLKRDDSPKVCETTVVEVPDMDDAAEFFTSNATEELIEVTTADFDDIFLDSADVLPSITKIKPKRTKASNSPNPYKALQMRQDIKSQYTDTKTDIADRELKRLNKSKTADKASRTALAGLATKEDINKISLKKTNHAQVMNPGGVSAAPYNDLMLIQIKGKRHVEMRIVQPSAKSINSGDCFLLVTKNKIFQWMGEFANLMEKSKAADLATYILSKKDLGCTLAKSVTVMEEAKQVATRNNEFWTLLGGCATYSSTGPVEEDELYEDYMVETNQVYRVNGEDLTPIEEYCGQIPRFDMLDDEQVLVFDFGTELYAWCGKLASMSQRKTGLQLTKLLYQSGYDYSECDINPLSPLLLPDRGGLPMKSDKRPSWAICGKVTANMETLLFKEKFYDWPESSRLIQTKDPSSETPATQTEELKAFDTNLMLEKSDKPVTLVLEQSNVGRGKQWVEFEDGIRREYQIDTLGVRMWHVSASDYYELMEDSYGQLHSCDTYVVRWQYHVKQSGVRNLKGNISKHQTQMGRERCAYFFWQGAQSTINEKGASALMTVELDEEHGPQVRVEQGLEPACFLSLFNGHMITHLGKRDDDEKKNSTKLYVVQNEHESEANLHEVPCRIESLRSRGVFIYINIKSEVLYVWFGSHSTEKVRSSGRNIAAWIAEQCPIEVGLSLESTIAISEVKEGAEPIELWTALRSNNRTKYDCMLKAPSSSQDYVARLFHMTSVNLVFHVQEIFTLARNEQYEAFPFAQCQLYKLHQPAIFLLDFGEDVYLWHGWWPQRSQDEENVSTGSARSRYTEDRKLALETSINYCKARKGKVPNMYCVYGGKEPLSFTNHFSDWEILEEATAANTLENRPSTAEDMNVCLQRLLKSVYTFDELQQRPLPDGVNPNKLETYLSDQQYNDILKMSREAFAALPAWKQTNLRKESNLF